MDEEKRLQEAFKYIRRAFFPRWDKKKEWKIRFDRELPSLGRCFPSTKTIVLSYVDNEDDKLYLLLIHEICHSTTLGHRKKWTDRMLRASKSARKMGQTNLSQMLDDDIEAYKKPPILAEEIYGKVRDAILIDNPNASYESIIQWIAYDLGLYPEEVEKRYKRCRKVYDKAVCEAPCLRKHPKMKKKNKGCLGGIRSSPTMCMECG